jgi:hypothetical protein
MKLINIWQGFLDEGSAVAMPLSTRNKNTGKTQISMPRFGFEPSIPMFERLKWTNVCCSKYLTNDTGDTRRNAYRSVREAAVFLFVFSRNLNMSTHFNKIPKYKILWKSVQCFLSFISTDGQTEIIIGAQ